MISALNLTYLIRDHTQMLNKTTPQSVIIMSYNLLLNNVNPSLPSPLVNGYNFTASLKLPNCLIISYLVKELYQCSFSRVSILQFFTKKEVGKLRSKFFKFSIAPNAKEVDLTIFILLPKSLRHRFNVDHNNCSFCDNDHKTTGP